MNFFKRHKTKILISTLVIIFSGFVFKNADIYFEIAKNIDIFTRVYKEISFSYVDEIEPEQFLRAGIRGMLGELDPYTVFIDEKRQDDIELLTNGKYGGIGISIGLRDGSITILEIMDGYSAQRQGLLIGDVIIEVDKTPIGEKNFDDVSSLVKGEPGSFVNLKILRSESKDTLSFDLLREEIVVKSVVFYGFVPENSNNAYIKLVNFNRTAGDEIKKAINELQSKKKIESMILDLRGNPGGLLDVAVDVSNKFIAKGELIVSTKGRDSSSLKQYFAEQEPLLKNTKLLLLINEGSASAAEIVAGAIQDHDRGVLLGTKSFGKGLVQTISPLSYNTSLKITTAKYFTPSGRCIQKIDYSYNSKVIAKSDSLIETEYQTDNKRNVYSSGGITPDSSVQADNISELVTNLLARGYLFKFVNQYHNKNINRNFSDLKWDDIFIQFESFVKSDGFKYSDVVSKQLDQIANSFSDKKSYSNVIAKIEALKSDIANSSVNELEENKDGIIKLLKQEMASRYLGTSGRIIEALKVDSQFKAAQNLLANEKSFNKLLNKN